jgi:small conductance mechanosensitive channel
MESSTDRFKPAQLFNDLQDINFLKIGMIIFCIWLGIFVTRRVFPFVAERVPNQLRLYLLGAVPIIRLVLMLLGVLLVTPIIFNINFQNLLVITGGASVAIGFAFKDYVSSLIAGVVAVFEKPYRPGDWVEIEGDYGEVQHVGLRAIQLLTPADDLVTLPNQHLWTKNVSNSNDGTQTLMCIAHFYLQSGHDSSRMRDALEQVALTSAYLHYPKPVKVTVQTTPWATHYQLKAYPFELRDQFNFISDLTIRGKYAIAELGAREASVPFGTDDRPLNHTTLNRSDSE